MSDERGEFDIGCGVILVIFILAVLAYNLVKLWLRCGVHP